MAGNHSSFFERKPSKSSPFGHAPARLTIGSLDDSDLEVEAHYNPHEIQIRKSIPWGAKGEQGKPAKATSSEQDSHEFTGAPTRTMTVELLFDGYETGESIEPIVEDLQTLSAVRGTESAEPSQRRPHYCVVAFGEQGVKSFRCVITSLAVRYTMFAGNGKPLRAVCTIELQEANLKSGPTVSVVRGAGPARATAAGS